MNSLVIPLVNWKMGTVIIGVFALVCVILVLVVMSLAKGDKKNSEKDVDIDE